MLKDYILNLLLVSDVSDDVVTEPEAEVTESSEVVEEQVTEEPEVSNEPISELDIDGEKYKIEDIKEWRNASMRNNDYMDRLSQLQRIEEEHKDAIELFNYLRDKPELAKKLYELDTDAPKTKTMEPQNSKISELEQQIRMLKIEKDLDSIKAKDKDINDVEILQLAIQRNVDVSTAYDMWRGANFDKILNKKLTEQSKKITDNIKKNKEVTKTAIPSDKATATNTDFGLSDVELQFAKKLDMTPEEYSKWKAK